MSLTVFVLLVAASPLFAQLPIPRLATIFPPGGKTGSTVEVTVAGENLDAGTQLHFSQPGLTAKPKLDAKGQPEANKFLITIPADAPVGVCDVRFAGRFGISNPRAFVIGDLPETLAPATNTTAGSAFAASLNSAVHGRLTQNNPAWFKFTAKKSQRVLVNCEAEEIDSRVETVLSLHDANGRELARNRRGGVLDFAAPADGEFRVQLHDSTFRGGDEYFFRLTVSAGPWIDFIHPSAGLPSTKAKYTLYGRNLPGGAPAKNVAVDGKPLEQLTVEIELPGDAPARQRLQSSALVRPGAAALDGIEYRLKSPHGVSNPARLGFATAPVIAEALEAPPKVQKLTPPCEFAGLFRRRGEPTVLTFDAKKGDVWWLEVFSQRLGAPTDPSALIERVTKNDKGEETAATIAELADSDANLGGPEFNTTSRDLSYRFEAKDDGLYRISVRDLFNRNRDDPRHLFRLALRKELPDFHLVALTPQPPKQKDDGRVITPTTPNLRRAETQVVKVLAFRRDGFNGEIQLTAEGLPTGVSSVGAKILEGKTTALLTLTAKNDATVWSGGLKIIGKAKVGGAELVREARGGSTTWPVADFNEDAVKSRLTRDLALGVSGAEDAPITIEPADAKTFEATDGKLKIPLKITRRGEFNENLKLKAVGVPMLDSLGELEVNAKTNAATLEIDLSKTKVPAGTHSFFLQAQTKGKFRSYETEAKSADDAAKLAEKEAKSAAEVAKKLNDTLAAAKKAGDEAAKQVKSASETDKEALATKAKSAADARAAAEKSATEATAKSKAADEKKTAAQETAKKLAEKSKAKEATIMIYSAPITIVVKPEEKKTEEKKQPR